MKLTIDPMPLLRAARKDRVNAAFNQTSQSHVEQAHAQKRMWAATNDPALQPEADLRGITVAELAAIILAKPDTLAERELQRQRIMMAIGIARTPAELDSI